MQTEILEIDQNTLRNIYAKICRNIFNKSEIMLNNVAVSKAKEEKERMNQGLLDDLDATLVF